MTKSFIASVWQERDWFVAQCLEVDVASQGSAEDEALANLAEALALYFEPPAAEKEPSIRRLEVEVSGP
jgi:predicted RNase H-like HicB family nuclease